MQAASASATPASLASLDSLMEGLLRTAGLPAKIQTLRWALSLRAQILGQVGLLWDHSERDIAIRALNLFLCLPREHVLAIVRSTSYHTQRRGSSVIRSCRPNVVKALLAAWNTHSEEVFCVIRLCRPNVVKALYEALLTSMHTTVGTMMPHIIPLGKACICLQADGGRLREAGHAQQLVLLYIYNASLLRLSSALGTRKLPELLLHLIASECPRLRYHISPS